MISRHVLLFDSFFLSQKLQALPLKSSLTQLASDESFGPRTYAWRLVKHERPLWKSYWASCSWWCLWRYSAMASLITLSLNMFSYAISRRSFSQKTFFSNCFTLLGKALELHFFQQKSIRATYIEIKILASDWFMFSIAGKNCLRQLLPVIYCRCAQDPVRDSHH